MKVEEAMKVEESGTGKNKNEWEAQSHNGWSLVENIPESV